MNITEYRRTKLTCFSSEEACDGTFTYLAVQRTARDQTRGPGLTTVVREPCDGPTRS